MAVPEKKSTIIIDNLNRLLSSEYSDFELNKYKIESKQLIKSDPVYAYIALGIISTLEKKENEMRDYFNKALKLDNHNCDTITNYSISLRNLAFFSEAFEKSLELIKLQPDNLDYINYAIGFAYLSGNIYLPSSDNLLRSWNKLNPGKCHSLEDYRNRALSILADNKFEPDVLKTIHSCIEKVLIKNKFNLLNSLEHEYYKDCIVLKSVLRSNLYTIDDIYSLEVDFDEEIEKNNIEYISDFFDVTFISDSFIENQKSSTTIDFAPQDFEIFTEKDLQEIDSILE